MQSRPRCIRRLEAALSAPVLQRGASRPSVRRSSSAQFCRPSSRAPGPGTFLKRSPLCRSRNGTPEKEPFRTARGARGPESPAPAQRGSSGRQPAGTPELPQRSDGSTPLLRFRPRSVRLRRADSTPPRTQLRAEAAARRGPALPSPPLRRPALGTPVWGRPPALGRVTTGTVDFRNQTLQPT